VISLSKTITICYIFILALHTLAKLYIQSSHALHLPWFFQGAGTAAHLMLKFWPWLQLVGWEIDPMVRTLLIFHLFLCVLVKSVCGSDDLPISVCDMLLTSHKNIINLSFVIYAKIILQPYLLCLMHLPRDVPNFDIRKADRVS
jgi:hypothetical protein